MPSFTINKNATNAQRNVKFSLRSTTNAQLLSGKIYSDFTGYWEINDSSTSNTLTIVSGTLGTYTDSSIAECNTTGFYQFGIPASLLLSSSATSAVIKLICAGAFDVVISINLSGNAGSVPSLDAVSSEITGLDFNFGV